MLQVHGLRPANAQKEPQQRLTRDNNNNASVSFSAFRTQILIPVFFSNDREDLSISYKTEAKKCLQRIANGNTVMHAKRGGELLNASHSGIGETSMEYGTVYSKRVPYSLLVSIINRLKHNNIFCRNIHFNVDFSHCHVEITTKFTNKNITIC